MTVIENQSEIIAFLGRAQTYGAGPVERVETHGAIVFLAGERAYKLKRAVKFIYMDYATPARRKAMCRRELEINRLWAPQLYLETRDIVRGPDGALRFAADAPDALDSVVVMRRFDYSTMLSRLCEQGRADAPLMRRLAEALAALHAKAEHKPGQGGAAAIRRVIGESDTLLTRLAGHHLAAADVASFVEASQGAIDAVADLLDDRARGGHVRHCHGDLHLNNIVVIDGEPVPFDGIEFNEAYSAIDTLYDLAFLLMDMERIKARPLAHALFARYLDCSADYSGLKALPLFLACRASIRAHVAISRAEATGDAAAADEGRLCLTLANRFLAPSKPALIAIGGFSGSGKSTLARAIAPQIGAAPGAAILRSDVIRKALMGVPELQRLPAGAYTPAMSARVWQVLSERARTILKAGHSVVLDAVHGRDTERAAAAALAQDCGASFSGVWLEGPREILINRIVHRINDVSDATEAVLDWQLAALEAPSDWYRLAARLAPEALRDLCLAMLTNPAGGA